MVLTGVTLACNVTPLLLPSLWACPASVSQLRIGFLHALRVKSRAGHEVASGEDGGRQLVTKTEDRVKQRKPHNFS